MQNRKTLTAATLACSLLSTSAVLAFESAHYQFAQAEAPAELNNQNAGQAAEDENTTTTREKSPGSEKGKANRKRGDREDRPGEKPRRPSENTADDRPQKAPEAVDGDGSKPNKTEKKKVAPPAGNADDDPAKKPDAAERPQGVDSAPDQREKATEEKAPVDGPVAKPKQERDADPAAEPVGEQKEKSKPPEPVIQPKAAPAAPQEQPATEKKSAPDAVEPDPKATAPLPSGTEETTTEPAAERKRDKQRPAATDVKDLKQVNENRKQRSEDDGKRIVIEEPDKRAIIKEDGRVIIRNDETERFRRLSRDTRVERRDGLNISVTVRPGGIQIFTDLDDQGRPLRRYRRGRDGRDVILFDNRDYYKRHRGGGSFIDAIIDLPPPRLNISRQQYIVDYDAASDDDLFDALSAPPVEELNRTYALEEVRRSPMLRDRMRRVDLDTIKFEFGIWDVSADQYPALKRAARAINRVIEKNPDEVFLIEGHTDAVGSDEDNLSLSDRRAESVAVLLTEEFDVPPENLTTQGYGEQFLKVQTDQAEQQNRRVAVRRITPLLSRASQ